MSLPKVGALSCGVGLGITLEGTAAGDLGGASEMEAIPPMLARSVCEVAGEGETPPTGMPLRAGEDPRRDVAWTGFKSCDLGGISNG